MEMMPLLERFGYPAGLAVALLTFSHWLIKISIHNNTQREQKFYEREEKYHKIICDHLPEYVRTIESLTERIREWGAYSQETRIKMSNTEETLDDIRRGIEELKTILRLLKNE